MRRGVEGKSNTLKISYDKKKRKFLKKKIYIQSEDGLVLPYSEKNLV